MKRQRNIQQVKDRDKCPPNQTKEEEIGSLHEKEFRIMRGEFCSETCWLLGGAWF